MAILGISHMFLMYQYKINIYFRWKLNQRYGDERVSSGQDPIPEHLFGNMWAQGWGALYDIAAPFPNAGDRPDATPAIQLLTIEEMYDYSDDFFRSLGMTPMTKLFWRNSVLEKRTDVADMVNNTMDYLVNTNCSNVGMPRICLGF